MIEVEGQTAADVSRFSAVLLQPDIRTELDRLSQSKSRGPTVGEVQLRVLKVHPDRGTFELSLDTGSGWLSVIGKVHEVDRSDVLEAMQSIVDAGFGPEADFAIPRPLVYVPSLHVLLEEKVQGTRAIDIFVDGGLSEQVVTARRCGDWLARFHTVAPRQGNVAEPTEMLVHIRYWAREIKRWGGPLGIKAALLLRKLEASIPDVVAFESCAGHGSYIPEHVMLSGPRTITIDLDEYDVADPARDAAWFIVSLERLGLKKRGSLRAHDRSVEAFLESYAASGPRNALTHLPFYKAAECLHRALRDLCKRNPPIPEWSDIMLDEGLSAI